MLCSKKLNQVRKFCFFIDRFIVTTLVTSLTADLRRLVFIFSAAWLPVFIIIGGLVSGPANPKRSFVTKFSQIKKLQNAC